MADLDLMRDELRNLLKLTQSRPTEDWTRELERIAELNCLVAEGGTDA